MKFFFDNQLSPHLAQSIHALAKVDGDEVVHKRDRFAPDTPDVEWIQRLSAEGSWVVVSGDLNILRTRAEKPVWKAARLIGFFLKKGWMNITPWDQAWHLIRWWPLITAQAKLAEPGSTYLVHLKFNGKLESL
jgi:hypothetical protein